MSENKPHKQKNQNLKTETSFSGKFGEVQFGKLVRLPYIRKISTNAQNTNISRKSLESKQTRVMRTSNKELNLLEHTHLNMLTLQEIQLCNENYRQKQGFPRIANPNPHPHPSPNNPFHREHSNDSLEPRERFGKSMTKMDIVQHLRDYKLGSIIGRGTYSLVRVARNREGRKVAVKIYLKSALSSQDRRKNLENEISVLSSVQHQSILSYKQCVETEESMNIVTELFDSRSLADYLKDQCLKTVQEETAKGTVKQLVRAIAYLHNIDIVHRDIKLENILISRDLKIKLIDFGFSRQLPKENYILYDFCGTPHYIAPEVIQRQGYYGKPADIWSLGVVIHRMIVGSFPFKGLNQKNLYSKAMKADLKLPFQMSSQLNSLLTNMLSFDFRKRPTADEIMASEWLAK